MLRLRKPKVSETIDGPRKLIVTGSSSSGKTCLLLRYCMNLYPDIYIPPVMDNMQINFPVFSRLVTLNLWDIEVSNCDFGGRLRPLSYIGASVVIICFRIDNPDSLFDVPEIWVSEVRHYTRDTKAPILLVGCKMDIRADPAELERMEKRRLMEPVSVQQGRDMAKSIGAAMYLECSAKTGQGVDEVFHHAA
ncbi:GTP-binding protein Rho1, partial [Serendipita sp. 400]